MKKELDNNYWITDDKSLLQLEVIHNYLKGAYWCEGIPKDIVERSINGSMSFGIYQNDNQIGFARVISDKATFAYLADVFILETHRGQGLSKRLMEFIFAHQDLQELRGWFLGTKDAHGLYEQFGFTALPEPKRFMRKGIKNNYLDNC
jgi:GNAT superfamily N-acetyltransferase